MKGPVCFGEGPECSEERPGGREGGEQENIHQPVLLLKPSASPGQAAPGTLISSFCPQLNESPFQGQAPKAPGSLSLVLLGAKATPPACLPGLAGPVRPLGTVLSPACLSHLPHRLHQSQGLQITELFPSWHLPELYCLLLKNPTGDTGTWVKSQGPWKQARSTPP